MHCGPGWSLSRTALQGKVELRVSELGSLAAAVGAAAQALWVRRRGTARGVNVPPESVCRQNAWIRSPVTAPVARRRSSGSRTIWQPRTPALTEMRPPRGKTGTVLQLPGSAWNALSSRK